MAGSDCSNPVVLRYYVKGVLQNESPLIIGSGEDLVADIQCVRDWEGSLFIPGSSLAGVLRSWAERTFRDATSIDFAFGEKTDDGKQSSLVVHDAHIMEGEDCTEVRDGVRLDKNTKTAENKKKYDYETIRRGCNFRFRLEAVIREKDKRRVGVVESLLEAMLGEFQKKGTFRLGAKVNRGLGLVRMSNAQSVRFDFRREDTRQEVGSKWLKFDWDAFPHDLYSWNEAIATTPFKPEHFEIKALFDIPGGLLIRSYSTDTEAPDAIHLLSNGIPVIPGTSWAGVIAQAIHDIGLELGSKDRMSLLSKALFGDVDESSKTSLASSIIIEESIIGDRSESKDSPPESDKTPENHIVGRGMELPYTRNRIDRFTGGVVENALFTEQPHILGTVDLRCWVRKSFRGRSVSNTGQPGPQACIGVLLLALIEIGNGIRPIGGACSIGRGILKIKNLSVDGIDLLEETEQGAQLRRDSSEMYLSESAKYLQAGKEE